jgi:hypothetical protein
MTVSAWRKWLGRAGEAVARRRGRVPSGRRRGAVLGLEALEARLVPATPTVVNAVTGYQSAPDPKWLTPAEVRAVYGFDNIAAFTSGGKSYAADGSGQTIAIVDMGSDSRLASDLQTFDNQFGLSPMDGLNGNPWLRQVNESAGAATPPESPDEVFETDLDVEWAHAIAPGANIVVVQTAFTTYTDSAGVVHSSVTAGDIRTAVQTAVGYGASVVSLSISGFNPDPGIISYPGVTIISTAGDSQGFKYPAGSAAALVVGGTTLNQDGTQLTANGNAYPGETVWNNADGATGGGYFLTQPLPSWQAAAAATVAGGISTRTDPDVAIVADFLATADSKDGGSVSVNVGPVNVNFPTPWTVGAGTSYGAPMWAGLIAIANQGRSLQLPGRGPLNALDPTLPMLYGLPSSDFHDIVSGGNGQYSARSGYDLVTGLGTPRADRIVRDLVAPFSGYYSQVTEVKLVNGKPVGRLVVYGNQNGGSDTITLSVSGSYLVVRDNGATDRFRLGSFSSVTVNTRNASDTVNVESTPAGVPLTVNLGSGTDAVNISPTAALLTTVQGDVTVHGGAGIDTLNVYDTANLGGNNYWLTSSSVTRTFAHKVTYFGIRTTNVHGGVGSEIYHVGVNPNGSIPPAQTGPANPFVNLYADGSGTNRVDVVSTPSGTLLTVNLSHGTDTVNISPTTQLLSYVAGAVTVNGGTGRDTLNVCDQANRIDSTYRLTGQSVSRTFASAAINFYNLNQVNVYGGSGFGGNGNEVYQVGNIMAGVGAVNPFALDLYTAGGGSDTVNVENTPAGMSLTLHLGAGADTVNVSPAAQLMANVAGPLTVNGGPGNDTLNVYDRNNNGPLGTNYWLTAYSVSHTFETPIDFSGMKQVSVYGGSGAETYHVGTMIGGPSPLPPGVAASNSFSLYTAGTSAERISVVDEYYADAQGNLQFSLDGLANLQVNGHAADTLIVDNSFVPPLPTGFVADPQTFTVSRFAVQIQAGASGPASFFFAFPGVGYSGVGTVEVDGGIAGEQFVVGDGTDNLDLLPAKVVIQGTGSDPLTLNDTPAPAPFITKSAPAFTVTGQSVTRTDPVTYTLFGTTGTKTLSEEIDYSGVSSLEIDGGNTATSFTVQSTGPGTGLTLKGGTGGNTFTVGTGVLSAIQETVHVIGGGGDTLNLNDQGNATFDEYVAYTGKITAGPFSRPGPAPTQTITYAGLAGITLTGSSAGAYFWALGSPAGTSLSFNAGNTTGGNFFLAFDDYSPADAPPATDMLLGSVAFHGHSIYDNAERYDYYDAPGHTFTLSANGAVSTLQRDGAGDLTFDGLGQMILYVPKGGGNHLNVRSVAPNVFLNLTVSSGDVAVLGSQAPNQGGTLANVLGEVSFSSEAQGASTVILDDSGDTGTAARRVAIAPLPAADGIGSSVTGLFGDPAAETFWRLNPGSSVSILGGAGDKTFALQGAVQNAALSIDGGGGTNTLDYSAYTGDVTVDLALGTATELAGISNIQNVTGGQGNNLLIGDANANVLRGGAGRNILIGGAGADQLFGGGGDNLLIGGGTVYDSTNLPALEAIMAEWAGADSFAARVAAIQQGVSSGGATYALDGATVVDDHTAADMLLGSTSTDPQQRDWFFSWQGDVLGNTKAVDQFTAV